MHAQSHDLLCYSNIIHFTLCFPFFCSYNVTLTKGTGKSKLMRSIAAVLTRSKGVTVLEISHDILLASYVGESEKKLREIFKNAHRSANNFRLSIEFTYCPFLPCHPTELIRYGIMLAISIFLSLTLAHTHTLTHTHTPNLTLSLTSLRILHTFFLFLRLAPSCILMDDVDLLCADRSGDELI